MVRSGVNRKTRWPLTCNSNGWLSVVPTKFKPAVVPLFPPVCHTSPKPLPEPRKVPVKMPPVKIEQKLADERAVKTVSAVIERHGIVVAAAEVCRRDRPADARRGHIFRENSIRCGRELLAWRQCGETAAPVRFHADLQPVRRTGEHAGAKINQHREQAVGDGDTIGVDRSGHRVCRRC